MFLSPHHNIQYPYCHAATDEHPEHFRHVFPYPDLARFRDDLDILCGRFEPISQEDVIHSIESGEPRAKRSFHLSFDDGLREIYDFVAPILVEKGIPASFYINSSATDNKTLMAANKASLIIEAGQKKGLPKEFQEQSHEEFKRNIKSLAVRSPEELEKFIDMLDIDIDNYLKTTRPYMTKSEIIDLVKQGFSIGSHTHEHKCLHHTPMDEQKFQVSEGVRFVREELELPGESFAFPYEGKSASHEIVEHIRSEGIRLAFGTNAPYWDKYGFTVERWGMYRPTEDMPIKQIMRQQLMRAVLLKLARKDCFTRN